MQSRRRLSTMRTSSGLFISPLSRREQVHLLSQYRHVKRPGLYRLGSFCVGIKNQRKTDREICDLSDFFTVGRVIIPCDLVS